MAEALPTLELAMFKFDIGSTRLAAVAFSLTLSALAMATAIVPASPLGVVA